MAYLVNLTARAERDLAHLYAEISAQRSDVALRWYLGLTDAILSLEKRPNRCPVTPEKVQLRHLLYGHRHHVYRVIFRVVERERNVVVLHVRHGARRGLRASTRRRQ